MSKKADAGEILFRAMGAMAGRPVGDIGEAVQKFRGNDRKDSDQAPGPQANPGSHTRRLDPELQKLVDERVKERVDAALRALAGGEAPPKQSPEGGGEDG